MKLILLKNSILNNTDEINLNKIAYNEIIKLGYKGKRKDYNDLINQYIIKIPRDSDILIKLIEKNIHSDIGVEYRIIEIPNIEYKIIIDTNGEEIIVEQNHYWKLN